MLEALPLAGDEERFGEIEIGCLAFEPWVETLPRQGWGFKQKPADLGHRRIANAHTRCPGLKLHGFWGDFLTF